MGELDVSVVALFRGIFPYLEEFQLVSALNDGGDWISLI